MFSGGLWYEHVLVEKTQLACRVSLKDHSCGGSSAFLRGSCRTKGMMHGDVPCLLDASCILMILCIYMYIYIYHYMRNGQNLGRFSIPGYCLQSTDEDSHTSRIFILGWMTQAYVPCFDNGTYRNIRTKVGKHTNQLCITIFQRTAWGWISMASPNSRWTWKQHLTTRLLQWHRRKSLTSWWTRTELICLVKSGISSLYF